MRTTEIEMEIHTLERTPAWTQGAAPYALPTNERLCGSQHTRPTAAAGTSPIKDHRATRLAQAKVKGAFSRGLPIIAAMRTTDVVCCHGASSRAYRRAGLTSPV
jgi:hypothetical protein